MRENFLWFGFLLLALGALMSLILWGMFSTPDEATISQDAKIERLEKFSSTSTATLAVVNRQLAELRVENGMLRDYASATELMLTLAKNNDSLIGELNASEFRSGLATSGYNKAVEQLEFEKMILQQELDHKNEGMINEFCSFAEVSVFNEKGETVSLPAGVCWSQLQFFEIASDQFDQGMQGSE